ncbi:HAD-IA family hydrolase [Ignatzschineria larvae DSM 13226]|uniref:HAD-IA family hydrolase n=1 Tax=Ignatzschineria larvae DSM 13226 TaxID=1111732 RepID=A0ABZ3BYI1_9GAMM|nr:HAD-IA family hydrolase [Ignatzschineria larvae]
MNILFYLEPGIEHGNPFFRYATLRNSLVPQAKSLKDHTITLLTSEHLAEKAVIDRYAEHFDRVVGVNSLDLNFGECTYSRLMKYQNNDMSVEDKQGLKKLFEEALGEDYQPDLIIIWESPSYFFKELYPNSKVLHQTPGFFSRAPYPGMILFNSKLLNDDKSFYLEKIGTIKNEELNGLDDYRNDMKEFLKEISPLTHQISVLRNKFERIVLFPLQIDNYFMINSCLEKGITQFDLLIEVLKNTPENICILVTNYVSKDIQSSVLSKESIALLRKNYPNFIYLEECDSIPSVSQFIVPFIDGVITISSSVGYQAAFYQKNLYLLGGRNQLTIFSSNNTLLGFFNDISKDKINNKDKEILVNLKNKNLPTALIDKDFYSDWLTAYVKDESISPWLENNIFEVLSFYNRKDALLKDLSLYKNATKNVTNDFCNELNEIIKRYDVISFDIFDTLLYRPFKSPSDLFKFIEPEVHEILSDNTIDFYHLRRSSESIAFTKAVEGGRGEITIDEIYNQLASRLDISDELKKKLLNLELETEFRFLYPRKSALAAFKESVASGKTVILISDMYLSKTFLEKVLNKNGYKGYKKLYVSSECGVKKHSGKLFDYVLQDLKVPAKDILHIGDNPIGDIKQAKARGLATFHLEKAIDLFGHNSAYIRPWKRDETNHSLDWRIILSIWAQKVHDNPKKIYRRGTVFNGSTWELGYMGLGILLLGYSKWLIENSIRDGIDVLYFLARDGKIMKQAYDLLTPLYPDAPKSVYMLCSRRSINLSKVKNYSDILDLLYVDFAHNVTLGHLLENRFGLNYEDIDEEYLREQGLSWRTKLTKEDLPRLRNLMGHLEHKVLDVARVEREAYLEYLANIGLLDSDKNIAVVDIGYAGTMQQSLYQLTNIKISGYYLITFRKALERLKNNGLKSSAYLAEFIDRHDTYHPFCRFVPLYETLFSSTDSSFIKMVKNWDGELVPVYIPPTSLEDKRKKFVSEVHEGALEFLTDVVSIMNHELLKMDVEQNKTLRLLDQLFHDPHPRDAKLFLGITFEDAYGGNMERSILSEKVTIDGTGVWRKGVQVLTEHNKNSRETIKFEDKTSKSYAGLIHPMHLNRKVTQKWIYYLITNFVTENKKRKFLKNPQLFFHDSKSTFIRILGKKYLKD